MTLFNLEFDEKGTPISLKNYILSRRERRAELSTKDFDRDRVIEISQREQYDCFMSLPVDFDSLAKNIDISILSFTVEVIYLNLIGRNGRVKKTYFSHEEEVRFLEHLKSINEQLDEYVKNYGVGNISSFASHESYHFLGTLKRIERLTSEHIVL